MARQTKVSERNELARIYLLQGTEPELEGMNKGELLEFCKHVGIQAHRGRDKADLIKLLEGKGKAGYKSPLDPMRDRLIAFMKLYWERVKHQLPNQCDGNCYGCGDIKVLACFRENRDHLFKHRS